MKRGSVTRELAAVLLLALTIAGAYRFWTYRQACRYEQSVSIAVSSNSQTYERDRPWR